MNEQSAISLLHNTMRLNRFALSSEQSYTGWLLRFMRYLPKLPQGLSSEQKMEAFLTTMGYLHAEALSVKSPLEVIG